MNKPNQLEAFLIAARSVHNTQGGTKETSYYPAISVLLDAIGATLKPKVRCVTQLNNQGAGHPDAGLFTPDQFDRKTNAVKNPLTPSRGVIEVKAPDKAVDDTVASAQIDKYWDRYKLVLVTNLRDWLLIGERNGQRVRLERFVLAASEKAFWEFAAHPRKAQESHGEAFADFLTRVLTHNAPLSDPKDVAALLASYAREARHRIELAGSVGASPLASVKKSLEAALGVKFDDEDGLHFFRSTLVQTLFYGLFAAWVLRHERNERNDTTPFDWQKAAHDLHVPMVAGLFEQLTMPSKLKGLNIAEVLDWTTDALNRVDQAAFFTKFESGRAVQYFYEPFLEAFDPELRKKLGVWYTPDEIVRYQVAKVDRVLREELGVPDGLADESVVVLDPCCGTGAYLVEVLRVIAETLQARYGDALMPTYLKRAATTRLFGFELLPAPYVVAHLQLGLQLRKREAALEGDERVAVYLTNALTGWEPTQVGSPKEQIEGFPEIAKERDAANKVKQSATILVIIGNPPYSGYAGVSVDEERGLSTAYKVAKAGPQPQGQGLNDPYIRFFRMAERQIAEHSKRGVISFISNSSWLEGLSHTAMRERFLEAFHRVRIDNLHGDKYATGKTTPTGEPDPSAFSTTWNREGIQTGTAISTLVRLDAPIIVEAAVETRSFWGAGKLERLAACNDGIDESYSPVLMRIELGRPFVPVAVRYGYADWASLPELFPVSYPGVKTSRDRALVDVDESSLRKRMARYFDTAISDATIAAESPDLMKHSARFDPVSERKGAIADGIEMGSFVRYCYRPMDVRWLYWHPRGKLLDEKRPDYLREIGASNLWIFTTGSARKQQADPAFVTRCVTDLNVQDSGARGVPLRLAEISSESHFRDNLSEPARKYITSVGATAEELFLHAFATIQSVAYRVENIGGLRFDWPHIPLPNSRDALLASAELGREIAALLDTETPVHGVTTGSIRAEFKTIGMASKVGGGGLKTDDFKVTAGWGILGKDDATMPGRGKTETRALLEMDGDAGFHQTLRFALGERAAGDAGNAVEAPWQTVDVYLNDVAYWRNIPLPVWEFTMGGYQVIKKWLSYREHRVLGRALKLEELTEVQNIARRIAALILLQPQLNAHYAAVIADVYPFPRATS